MSRLKGEVAAFDRRPLGTPIDAAYVLNAVIDR